MKRKRNGDEDLLVLKMRRTGTSSWLPVRTTTHPVDLHHSSATPQLASPSSVHLPQAASEDPHPVLRLRRTGSRNWSVLDKVCLDEGLLSAFLAMLTLG